jgi:Xaa-Pro aminopeptidase
MKDEISSRINRLFSLLKDKGVEAVYLATEEHSTKNVQYFSNFTGSMGYLLLSEKENMIFTDSRYWEQTADQSPLQLVKIKETNMRAFVASYFKPFKRIGFESKALTVESFDKIKSYLPEGTEWIPVDSELTAVRCSKSMKEKEKIITANQIALKAFRDTIVTIREGMTEKEIAVELEYKMVKYGAQEKSFGTIVASGWRGALPHGAASSKQVKEGEFIVFDFGCVYEGYCSDITRTIAVGKPSEKMMEVYALVKEAQNTAEKSSISGATGKAIDSIARKIIADKGYSAFFGHGLGHGLGLDVHEEPRLSQANENPLPVGSVVTVEPGIYLPGQFGVRIENDVFLTEDGHEVLTDFPTDLIIV